MKRTFPLRILVGIANTKLIYRLSSRLTVQVSRVGGRWILAASTLGERINWRHGNQHKCIGKDHRGDCTVTYASGRHHYRWDFHTHHTVTYVLQPRHNRVAVLPDSAQPLTLQGPEPLSGHGSRPGLLRPARRACVLACRQIGRRSQLINRIRTPVGTRRPQSAALLARLTVRDQLGRGWPSRRSCT